MSKSYITSKICVLPSWLGSSSLEADHDSSNVESASCLSMYSVKIALTASCATYQ